MPRGHWVGYLKNNFELDVRNPGQWLQTPRPKAFATALVGSLGLWCEIIQLSAAKPR